MQITRFINRSLEEMGMIDIWRNLHPLEKEFTHYSAVHQVHIRVDYMCMKAGDGHRVKECRIGGADVSDHNPLFLKIGLNNRKQETIWKLNVGILNNEQRKGKIRAKIKEIY